MRSIALKTARTAVTALERAGAAPSLNPDNLKNAAIRRAKLDDFGDLEFEHGLAALVRSSEEDARLNALGRLALRQSIVTMLVTRLKRVEAERSRPALFTQPLTPPIVVLGMARSGTTLLHRLLSLDPRHRGIPAYEIYNPFPWESQAQKIRRLNLNAKLLLFLAPDIAAKHAPQVTEPEECTGLLATSFSSLAFCAAAPVYGYADWVLSQNAARTYREYVSFLHILQSTAPETRLTLKSPLHTPSADVFHDALQSGVFIQIHRDPAETVASLNSFAHSYHSLISDIDEKQMAAFHLNLQAELIDRNLEIRARRPSLIHDVFYPELLEDPVRVIRDLYDRCGLGWRTDNEALVNAWLNENPQQKYGRHVYDAETFGQTPEHIRARFSNYLDQFGERLGL
ncbi:sulfotransferase family protein [Hyphococcus sp.]|uniref:sulfotransferase family protein n=1 Tax=Hyphococcus sp. TaxID=2038636 RepID=UPI003CCBA6AA